TSRSEAVPDDLMRWTGGRAVIGTGSPFPPIRYDGRDIRIAQTNNAYIFPGVGLGTIAAKARNVTDGMFMAAAPALARLSPALADPQACLLPPVGALREVAQTIARAVGLQAYRDGVAEGNDPSGLEGAIRSLIWTPAYRPYRRA